MVTIYWGKHCHTSGPESYACDWCFSGRSAFKISCEHVKADIIYKDGEEFYVDWGLGDKAIVLCIRCARSAGFVW